MRKSVIDALPVLTGNREGEWMDLETAASVQVTSEAAEHPIESAFSGEERGGWQAAHSGEQVIRILFDRPTPVRRIQLRFLETGRTRTQEFVLRCVTHDGASHEMVRQQWNFSPSGSTSEEENYSVSLENVSVLELVIKPDLGGGSAVATLASLRIA